MRRGKAIFISRSCKRKLIRWTVSSWKEIGFLLCVGPGNKTHVERIRNTALYPVGYYNWNSRELAFTRKALKKKGFRVLAEGHSHPAKRHPAHPSSIDVRTMEVGHIEIIVAAFPTPTIGAWKIKRTLKQTLASGRIPIVER